MRNQKLVQGGKEENYYEQIRTELKNLKITKKERRAMILGALQVILPIMFIMAFLYFGILAWIC